MSEKFVVEGGLSIPSGSNLEIAGVNLGSITTSATLSGNSTSAIPSEYSVKAYVDSQLGASDIDLKLDGSAQTSIDQSTGKLGFASTANEIEIAYAHDGTDGVFTIGLPNDVTIGNDLTVTGTLNAKGDIQLEGNGISGNASEMVISADGDEASVSGSANNSMSLNASGGIFTDDPVDMDSTLNVENVATFQAQSVHSLGLQTGGDIVSDTDSTDSLGSASVRWADVHTDKMTMEHSARKDFSVSPAGSATTVFTFDDTAYKSGKIVASIEDASGNVTAQEILVVSDGTNAKALVYGTVSSGTEVSTTWAISTTGGTATVTCDATGTLKGHYDLQAV